MTSSASHRCWKLTNCEQGSEGLERPLSAHLASLSQLVLISSNFFGFCEAAWPCLAMGSARNNVNPEHRLGLGRWGRGGGKDGLF